MSKNILLTYFTSTLYSKEIVDYFTQNGFNIFTITEDSPDKLSIRAQLIKSCDCLVVLASRNFQKKISCMEVVHFAKDCKKQIYGIITNSNYKPFGALGAILCMNKNGCIRIEHVEMLKTRLGPIVIEINKLTDKNNNKNLPINSHRIGTPMVDIKFLDGKFEILISYHSKTKPIADLIEEALLKQQITYKVEDSSLGSSFVKGTKVLVVIMSPEYEENFCCRLVVQTARELSVKIVPISITREWKPTDWLGLITGGVLFYRIFDKEQAYKQKYDSTPMNDLIVGLMVASAKISTENERETQLIDSLKKRIEECKSKSIMWPPKHKLREIPEEKPVKIEFIPPTADLAFNHTHTTITRINFKPPPILYDSNGLPIRNKFDCMISYQWGKQELVRYLYMDFSMRSLKIWFDIWGGMQGNSNDAMATAIECSKIILVFLSTEYQKSDNCKLEFNYAVSRGKPFIFILLEPNLKIENWIEPYYADSLKYEIYEMGAEGELLNGVPKINVISQAIRKIGEAQPEHNYFELSEEVIRLQELLSDALDQIAENTGVKRYKTCTRCKKEYESCNPDGCKTHSAYYMGGSILAARWVCCEQQEKNAIGCIAAKHTDKNMIWYRNPDYGTYTWVEE